MINVIKYKYISFTISGILFATSIVLLFVFGLKPGLDFTGGSLIEVSFAHERPSVVQVQDTLFPLHLGAVVVQPTGDKNILLRLRYITPLEHEQILSALRTSFAPPPKADPPLAEKTLQTAARSDSAKPTPVQIEANGQATIGLDLPDFHPQAPAADVPAVLEQRIETIGPAISSTLKTRAVNAAVGVIFAIIAFIAYAFRKVSKPVASWRYGVAAVVALIHDVTITAGIFALIGHFTNFEMDIPFVVALMTIFGYSVNDTIVVFDRIREMLLRHRGESFSDVVNMGVNQTYVRSINTSFTVLLVLFSMFMFGGESIHYFSLVLLIGIFFGTYSSIYVAAPLILIMEKLNISPRRA